MAMMEDFKKIIWFSNLLDDLGIFQEYINIHCDSQSAIKLAKNQYIIQVQRGLMFSFTSLERYLMKAIFF